MVYSIERLQGQRAVWLLKNGQRFKMFVSESAARKYLAEQEDHAAELAGIKSIGHLI